MNHYVDLKILPDPEFQETTLLNALFAKLHRALYDKKYTNIGISFPDANRQLGRTLRLHGDSADLAKLMNANWLSGMRDYTQVTEISPVPVNCKYQKVRRVQVKSSVERLRRRSVAKKWLSAEKAADSLNKTKEQRTNLPYLQVNSHSTKQKFRIFISHSPPLKDMAPGTFNAYGISLTATVPLF